MFHAHVLIACLCFWKECIAANVRTKTTRDLIALLALKWSETNNAAESVNLKTYQEKEEKKSLSLYSVILEMGMSVSQCVYNIGGSAEV